MNEKMELLEGIEPIIVEDISSTDSGDNKLVSDMVGFSFASNIPECGGPIYSNTYWLPEDVDDLLNDLRGN